MKKEEILGLVARQMENNITEIRNSIRDYEDASNMDEGDTIDPEDFSQQSEKKELQYQMQIQLDHALSGLSQLKEMSGKSFSIAKSGALIETEKNFFLLGISSPSVTVGNKELLGISSESPAFGALNGKEKGEHFNLGKNTYTILAVS